MIYCRDCHRFWPSGAVFCGCCRRSFGGRRCESGHLSPTVASCCITCGSRKLTRAAPYADMGCLLRMFAIALGLVSFKVLLANFGLVGGLLACTVGFLWSFVIGDSASSLFGGLITLTIVLVLFWIAIRRILGPESRAARGVEKLAMAILVACGKAALKIVRFLIVWIATRSQSGPRGGRT